MHNDSNYGIKILKYFQVHLHEHHLLVFDMKLEESTSHNTTYNLFI